MSPQVILPTLGFVVTKDPLHPNAGRNIQYPCFNSFLICSPTSQVLNLSFSSKYSYYYLEKDLKAWPFCYRRMF